MKLDTKHTMLVGFAFLSICAFWQMYDNLIPLMLTNTFHMNKVLSGAIMAADNVLALFLLPLFGGLSDRCSSRLGRRRPFVLFGTVAAVILMMGLPLIANSYHAAPVPYKEILFVGVLGMLLVAMGVYRSPAVALMPDVTPKPLRSKANAIINLMGAIGGVLYLVATFFYRTAKTTHEDYTPLFAIVGGVMVAALLVLMFFVDEPKLVARQREYELAHPDEPDPEDLTAQAGSTGPMTKGVRRSLGFLLISIALWFIGYNAVTTWFSTYATTIWGMSLSDANQCLTIATGGAIITYLPVGALASRIGRKRTIRYGTILLSVCFAGAAVYSFLADQFHPGLYVLFALVGVAWAAINVNSLPMVVEMCSSSEVGKFTGMYYTFSMAAQTATPILSGALLQYVDNRTLFPYAAIFVAASFVTMGFVRHGDSVLTAPAQ